MEEEELSVRNVSVGGHKAALEGDVDAGDDADIALQAIGAFDYDGNLTINREMIEALLRQMEYENNFDSFTQVSLVRKKLQSTVVTHFTIIIFLFIFNYYYYYYYCCCFCCCCCYYYYYYSYSL